MQHIFREKKDVEVYGRRIRESYLRSAMVVAGTSVLILFTMTVLLSAVMPGVDLADVLYDWFHSKNFQVTVCHDGISGYETALKNSYDAIISDVMLPGIDGFSIVKNLRSMKVRTPVIMLTARVELQDKLQGFDAGAEDYLTKPFEIEELDARVKVPAKEK